MNNYNIINDFREGQKVWFNSKGLGVIFEGEITDQNCSKDNKFTRFPLRLRTKIPIKWRDGSFGTILYSKLSSKKLKFPIKYSR